MDKDSYLIQKATKQSGSVTLTCRFDKNLYHLLQKDAERNGGSLNFLINSIVKRYASWEKYAEEIGFIPLTKETVRLIFKNLDDQSVHMIANQIGRTIPKKSILLMFNKIDFDSIISFFVITLSRYGMVQHEINGRTHDIILHHNVNSKFSDFLAQVARAMAKDLHLKLTVQEVDRNVLFISIKEIPK
ncbi:MAG: hypothetical protein ACE5KA_09255 [Nitrososphaerales archaeon]